MHKTMQSIAGSFCDGFSQFRDAKKAKTHHNSPAKSEALEQIATKVLHQCCARCSIHPKSVVGLLGSKGCFLEAKKTVKIPT